jgi:hypothetical protein
MNLAGQRNSTTPRSSRDRKTGNDAYASFLYTWSAIQMNSRPIVLKIKPNKDQPVSPIGGSGVPAAPSVSRSNDNSTAVGVGAAVGAGVAAIVGLGAILNGDSSANLPPMTERKGSRADTNDPNALWRPLIGRWTGIAQASGGATKIRVSLIAYGNRLSGFFTDGRLSGGLEAKILVAGQQALFQQCSPRQQLCDPGSELVLDGRLSPDQTTIEGDLTVWMWRPKTTHIVLTKVPVGQTTPP